MAKKITYAEISKSTGISISTISRVVKGNIPVKNDTRERVITALKEYGYFDNINSNYFSKIIFVNIPSMANPFYSEIIKGIETSAKQYGMHVIINVDEINNKTIKRIVRLLKETHASGLITLNHIEPEILKILSRQITIVQCCERVSNMNLPFVTINDIQAAKKAMNHLISHNNKRIAFINGPNCYKYSKDRLEGYKESLEENNLAYDPKIVVQLPDINYDLAFSNAMQLLTTDNRPDAFFTSSDVLAAAVINAAKKCNISIPEELEVIGFDNINIATMVSPSITTISQPKYQLGIQSSETLCRLINGTSGNLTKNTIDTELILRESTK
jgi:LacI family repressor for deo operon, udp, cdd, tsx, nupC, and nupG